MGFTDPQGVNLSDYHLLFSRPGLTEFLQYIFIFFAELVMYLLNTVVLFVLWLVQSLVGEGFILDFIVAVVDTVLKALHSFLPPFVLATLAFSIVVLRALLPSDSVLQGKMWEKIRVGKFSKGLGVVDSPRRLWDAIRQGVFVFIVVLLLSANPLKIVQRIAQFAASFAVDGNNGSVTWATDLVQTLYSMTNFQVVVGDSCLGVWSNELASTYGEATATCVGLPPVEAGFSHVFMSLFSVLVYACIVVYLAVVLYRGVFLFAYAIWDVVTLPYVLAIHLFTPEATEDTRYAYDKAYEAIARAAVYLAYYVFAVFLLTSGPSIVLESVARVDAHWVFVYFLMAVSFLVAALIALHLLTPRINDGRPRGLLDLADRFGAVTSVDEQGRRKIRWKATAQTISSTLRQTTLVTSTVQLADTVSTHLGGPMLGGGQQLTEDQKKLLDSVQQDTGVRDQQRFAQMAVVSAERAEKKLQSDKSLLALKRRMKTLTPEQLRAEEQRIVDRQLLIDAVRKSAEGKKFQASLVKVPAEYEYMFAGRTHISTEELRQADLAHLNREVYAVTGVSVKSLAEFNTVGSRYAQLSHEMRELEDRRYQAQEVGDTAREAFFQEQLEQKRQELAELEPLKRAKDQFLNLRETSWAAPSRLHFDDLSKDLPVFVPRISERDRLRAEEREQEMRKLGITDEQTFEDFQNRHIRLEETQRELDTLLMEESEVQREYRLGILSPQAFAAETKHLAARRKELEARKTHLAKLMNLAGDTSGDTPAHEGEYIEVEDLRYTDGQKLRLPKHVGEDGEVVMPDNKDVAQWIIHSEKQFAAEEVSRTFAPLTSALRVAQRKLSEDSDTFISEFSEHSEQLFAPVSTAAQAAASFTGDVEFAERLEKNKQRLLDLQREYQEASTIPSFAQRTQAQEEIAQRFTRALGSVQHTALSAAQASGDAHIAARANVAREQVLEGLVQRNISPVTVEDAPFTFTDPATWNPTWTPAPTEKTPPKVIERRRRKAEQALAAVKDAVPQDEGVTATGKAIERRESTIVPVSGPVGENVLQAGSLIQYAEAKGVEAVSALPKTETGQLSSDSAVRVDLSSPETQAGFTVKYDMKRAQMLADAAGQSSMCVGTENVTALPAVESANIVEVTEDTVKVRKRFD